MQDNNLQDIDITDTSSFEDETHSDNSCIIKVIGVGGGGGNAVDYMFTQEIANVNFVVCNTDEQALEKSPVPNKLLLGYSVTKGRGAGDKPMVGAQCAEASADEIRKLFTDGTEMVFVTAGMGGGTGTGASPIVAKLAKEAGMLTIGIVTIPFLFEGVQKIKKAIKGAEELKKYVDALLIINNENLIELYPDFDFFNAFSKADDTLANAARSISEIISERMYINVDFEDVRTTLTNAGTAIISTAHGEGENRVSDAIKNALESPLLKKENIKSAKRLLLKFAVNRFGPKPLMSNEIRQITAFTNELPSSVSVKWGIADDPSLGDQFKITVLAAGFEVSIADGGEKIAGNPDPGHISFDPAEPQTSDPALPSVEEIYGPEKMASKHHDTLKHRYAVLTPDQFDDHDVIYHIERNPAFNRDLRHFHSLRQPVNPAPSRQQARRNDTPDSADSSKIVF